VSLPISHQVDTVSTLSAVPGVQGGESRAGDEPPAPGAVVEFPATGVGRPILNEEEQRQVLGELAALHARLRPEGPDCRQPIATRSPVELAWCARSTAAETLRHGGPASAPAARLVLQASRGPLLTRLAAEVFAGTVTDPMVQWRVVFSAVQTRQIIGAVRELVERVCAEPLRELEGIRDEQRRCRKGIHQSKKAALELGHRTVGVLRDLTMTVDERSTSCRLLREGARVERARVRKLSGRLRELEGALRALDARRPAVCQVLDALPSVCALWEKRDGLWLDRATDLRTAQRDLPGVLDVITEHTLALVWAATPPRRWLVRAGYHPAPAEIHGGRVRIARKLRTVRARAFTPPLPVGMELVELLEGDLSPSEWQALTATQRGEKRRHSQKLDAWLAQVVGIAAADPAQAGELRALEAVWALNGAEGRRAAQDHYAKLGRHYAEEGRRNEDGQRLPPQPHSPELVAIRWPRDGQMRYAHVGVDVSLVTTSRWAETGEPEEATGPARVRLLDGPLCVLDTETTGLSREAEVHEIGAVLLDEYGDTIAEYSGQGRPEDLRLRGIHRALRVSGLSVRDLVRRKRPIGEVIEAFSGWLSQHGRPVCVAYNQRFDKRLLAQTGLDDLSWGEDIQETVKRALKLKKATKLALATEALGVEAPPQNHRAVGDARQAAAVLLAARLKLMEGT